METIEDLLESHPFFAGLSPYALRLIAGCASNVHFDEGSRIFGQGEPASLFYVIRDGRVALEVHSPTKGPLTIDTMNGGEVLGWSWLIPPYQYFASARAVTPVRATALDGACLRGKCEADTELGYQLLTRVTTVMYQRLQSTRIRLLDLYG
jgi:CRP/FNR family transcriptional regulator, cyclic AMP receptor protein